MRSIGRGEDRRAGGAALLDPPEVDIGGREQAEAAVVMFRLYQGKKTWPWARASWIEPNRSGNPGRYFSVLNWASENGLSFDTCGRLCVLVTPRSASKRAMGLEVIAEPRSAWIVNWPRAMPWRAHVAWMNCSARLALSRWA